MQNPFLRLKHYRVDPTSPDLKENHATEVLATALVLSGAIRAEFLSFLFERERAFTADEAESWSVETQVPTDDGDWVDLLIEEPGVCSVVVEVKVGAAEDGYQVKRYVDWLEREKGSNSRHVFWLVRKQNHALQIQDFGGRRRFTWHALYERFVALSKTAVAPTDLALLRSVCEYLEAESIVSTWKPDELLDFSIGLRAKAALEKLFSQVEERLREFDGDYEVKAVWTDDPWTRLEVGRKSWTSIFGFDGRLNKVSMYFPCEGMGSGPDDQFHLELVLWNRWQKGDWAVVQASFSGWLAALRVKGFDAWIVGKRGRALEVDVSTYKLDDSTVEIKACHSESAVSGITANQIKMASNTELVELLAQRIILHCDVISGFAKKR